MISRLMIILNIKNMRLLLLLALIIALGSCQQQKTNKDKIAETEESNVDYQSNEDFLVYFAEFQKDFNLKNVRKLNRYIDGDNGLVVIITKDFYAYPYGFKHFGDFMTNKELALDSIQRAKMEFKPEYGAKPVLDCASKQWNKVGCFWNDKPSSAFTTLYDALMEHHLIPHNPTLEAQLKTVDVLATRMVYDSHTNMGFYFNRINGKWYLLAIEKINPCMTTK
jgi:hypothetical protein